MRHLWYFWKFFNTFFCSSFPIVVCHKFLFIIYFRCLLKFISSLTKSTTTNGFILKYFLFLSFSFILLSASFYTVDRFNAMIMLFLARKSRYRELKYYILNVQEIQTRLGQHAKTGKKREKIEEGRNQAHTIQNSRYTFPRNRILGTFQWYYQLWTVMCLSVLVPMHVRAPRVWVFLCMHVPLIWKKLRIHIVSLCKFTFNCKWFIFFYWFFDLSSKGDAKW